MDMNEIDQAASLSTGSPAPMTVQTKSELVFDRVFRSSDDMLYLTGGSNEAALLYTETGFRRKIDSEAWKQRFQKRQADVLQTGSLFAQLIAPEKLTIYPLSEPDRQRLFPGLEAADIIPPGRRLLQDIEIPGIFYPEEYLRQQRLAFPVYWRTDSHWTWRGAFSAFQAVMWGLGYQPTCDNFVNLPRNILRYRGDLWEPGHAEIEVDQFERICLPPSIQRVYANQIVGFKEQMGLTNDGGLHGGSHCIFHNHSAEFKETVVIFGSSFSECRLEASFLTSIFAFYFETVHFIWSTTVDLEYIARHRPNITISEIPERFLTLNQQDSSRVEEYAVDKLRIWQERNKK